MDFIDVTDWISDSSTSTRGTRDKNILVSPDGGTYFLKFPMQKVNRDYSAENWSEIIAYKVGRELGFDILEYTLAVCGDRIGCVSKNMVDTTISTLTEGESILVAHDYRYNPEDKDSYAQYTFGFVCDALKSQGLGEFITDFIRILIFDSIIGNSDRHQGNWGFIQTSEIKIIDNNEDARKTIFGIFNKRRQKTVEQKKVVTTNSRMAPIYDSGCCLAREFDEARINDILNDDTKFSKYISKGYAELRADNAPENKKTHFDLLSYIASTDDKFNKFIIQEVKNIKQRYSKQKLKDIIYNIDSNIPVQYRGCSNLTPQRKELIFKLISERINILFSTFHVS